MSHAIDISSELGEGFALPPFGLDRDFVESLALPRTGERFHHRHGMARADEAMLALVSSVTLACGMHSGDPVLMHRSIAEAVRRGIRIGAHPSYPDVFRFGQKRVELPREELASVIAYQLGALKAVLARFGQTIQHVKCHGALQFDVSRDEAVCAAMAEAIGAVDPGIVLVLLPNAPTTEFARGLGLTAVQEMLFDRGYDDAGWLVPRSHPQALITEPEAVADRVLDSVLNGEVTSVDGKRVPMRVSTYCMHSDTPGADAIAAAVAARLAAHDVAVRPLAEVLARETR